MFRKAWLIFTTDLRTEYRAKDVLPAMVYFSLLVLVIFNFAIDLRDVSIDAVAPGMLWVGFCFAGILGLNRSFSREQERGAMDGLMLAPMDRSAIYFGKLLTNFCFMALVEVVMVPVFALLFNVTTLGWMLVPSLALGTLGFAAVGTFFAALAVNTRSREVLLPVLVFPLVVPIIIAAVKTTGASLSLEPFAPAIGWLNLMVAFDAIFLAVSYVLFGAVLEE